MVAQCAAYPLRRDPLRIGDSVQGEPVDQRVEVGRLGLEVEFRANVARLGERVERLPNEQP